ncbi:putative helicase MOV-10 [Anopheles ziemanni]|nr:putative helicase MOV-10 [Anopheles ziemanni]
MTRCLHRWYESALKLPGVQEPMRISKPIFRLEVEYSISHSILSIRIQNMCQKLIILRSIYLFYGKDKRVSLFNDVLRMVPGYEFRFEKNFLFLPDTSYNVVFLSQLSNTECQLREIATIYFLQPRQLRGPQLTLKKLPPFDIPEYVKEVHFNDYLPNPHYSRNASLWLERYRDYLKQGLNPSNYLEHLRTLNQIDDYTSYLEMLSYTINDAHLVPLDIPKQYLLSTDQFPTPPVLLDVGSFVRAFTLVKDKYGEELAIVTRGFIAERNASILIVMENALKVGCKVKIDFPLNRTQFQMEYQSLDYLNRIDFATVTFPSIANQTVKKKGTLVSKKHTKFDWFQDQIADNELQQQAIKNIINRTAYPAPYILFGPPGTGKTSTIVEAVLQIYKLQPHSRILVTASSNYACNELAKRLLKYVQPTDIYRYMSLSTERDINLMDLSILEISNMHMGTYETPSMEDFVQTRILVCTIMNSARLIQLGVKTAMYDYIFIDECGSSKELSALVPIACVGTEVKTDRLIASVILAGDPKQLGPVTHSTILRNTAHNVSLLERLMELPYYKKDLNNNEYNTDVVTKLLDNYRSHKSIFAFSNKAFYEGELRARAPPEIAEWAIGWARLPNPKFPMIFHSIVGKMIQDQCTLSYLNCEEARVVYDYVQELLNNNINGQIIREEDIGIITPYSRQVEYIKKGLSNLGLDNIEVGSAEQYQGREKPVIIVSTVRSGRKTVGFLSDPRRLNVVMTRAKALMIIIGNPLNLSKDPTWHSLLQYLMTNKAFIGRKFTMDNNTPLVPPKAKASTITSQAIPDFA